MRFSMRCLCSWALAASSAVLPRITSAQSERSPKGEPPTSLTAFSVGVLGVNGESEGALTTVGLHFTQLKPSRLSGDFAIGTVPAAVFMGVVAVGVRAGGALPLRLSGNSFLLPSAGLSSIVGLSEFGGGGLLGANVGMSAFLANEQGRGVRVGVTWHKMATELDGAVFWLFEMGVGW